MKVTEMLHVSLLVADLAISRHFYEDVLQLTPSPLRPGMSFDGIWYEIGRQQIHLLVLPNPDPLTNRPAHGGRDRHLALGVDDLDALKSTLVSHGIPFTLSQSGRAALFCRDPDGNALELIGS